MLPDIEAVTGILEEVAEEEILPRFQALKDEEVHTKASGDLVTDADIAAEQALSRRLCDLLPGSAVIGEEAVEADASILNRLTIEEPVWIIDPIDGTSNFVQGKPEFAVMVALVRGGQTLAGWILDPLQGRTAIAALGAGAWMDGQRLRVAKPALPSDMIGTLHAGTYTTAAMAENIRARRNQVGAIKSLRCAGHQYLRLVTGEHHFALFTRLMPWDHAPGVLIHREAGGVGRTLDGEDYIAGSYDKPGLILAPDQDSWQNLYATLLGGQ